MKTFCLHVSGNFACFTRPEMKVERVSYDVITPSAVRGIYEAIMWKPAIRWIPTQIEVLNPVRWINLRRNEVKTVIPLPKKLMENGKGNPGIYAEEHRVQRAGLFLRDVSYRLHARFEMTEHKGAQDNPGKFCDMFTRRAKAGQCFNQPYLGCREFSADFEYVDDVNQHRQKYKAIAENNDLGFMLYDINYPDMSPMLYRAKMENGIITVPAPDSNEIRR